MNTVNLFLDTIDGRLRISPLVLIPMTVLLILGLMKYSVVPNMAIGMVLAVLVAVLYQGCPMGKVMAGLNYGYAESIDVKLADKLLLRSGIQSMTYTLSLSYIAISFGGVVEHVGYLPQIVKVIIRWVRSDRMTVPVVITSITLDTPTMGEVFLSIVVNGSLYKEAFRERGLRLETFSRLLEEGGILTQVSILWSIGGVFILSTLGVGVSRYWKYAVLNYVDPVLSIVLAMFGICVLKVGTEEKRSPCRELIHSHKLS